MTVHYCQQGSTIIVFGNTFPIKDKIKALGGRFNGSEKNWRVPLNEDVLPQIDAMCTALGGGCIQANVGPGESPGEELTAAADPLSPNDVSRASLAPREANAASEAKQKAGRAPKASALTQQGALLSSWGSSNRDTTVPPDDSLTIRQLMDRIALTVSAAFPQPVWIVGEVQNLAKRASGLFLDLAEGLNTGHQSATLTARAILWNDALQAIRGSRSDLQLDDILHDGMQVRLLCQVQLYRDRGQITLLVQDIDPAYTRGALALAREKLLRELRQKNLDRKNKQCELSPFPFRIGLISAEGSRAQSDFLDQLISLGFPGEIIFCPTPMQGDAVPTKVVNAIASLVAADCDMIVITRGGGSAADLRWFDAPEIALAIVHCPVAVVAAIGHHDDVSVAEEICFRRQKTPTAAADFVVACFSTSSERIDQAATMLAHLLQRRIDDASRIQAALAERLAVAGQKALEFRSSHLQQRVHQLQSSAVAALHRASERLSSQILPAFTRTTDALLQRRREQIDSLSQQLVQRDPTPWLAQGWTRLLGPAGQVTRIGNTSIGNVVHARLLDGRLTLQVIAAETRETAHKGIL